jgi:hypothetical protein
MADDLAPVKCHPFYYELVEGFFHLWNKQIFISKEASPGNDFFAHTN